MALGSGRSPIPCMYVSAQVLVYSSGFLVSSRSVCAARHNLSSKVAYIKMYSENHFVKEYKIVYVSFYIYINLKKVHGEI